MNKYKITNRVSFKTIYWTIKTDNDTYYVKCQEGEYNETWYIDSDKNEKIDANSEIGNEIIDTCTDYEIFDIDED